MREYVKHALRIFELNVRFEILNLTLMRPQNKCGNLRILGTKNVQQNRI